MKNIYKKLLFLAPLIKGVPGTAGDFLPQQQISSLNSQLSIQSGNALITLLFFMFIGITILTSTGLVLYNSIFGTSQIEQGQMAYYAAESGIENGILYRLRNPLFTGNLPAVTVNSIPVTINIDSNGIITSTATYGSTVKKMQVNTASSSGALNISSWKEATN
jgi:hypothetical protein